MSELKAKNASIQRVVDAYREFEAAVLDTQEQFVGRYDGDYHWRAVTGALPGLQQLSKQILMAIGQAVPEDRAFAFMAAGRKEKDLGQAKNFTRIAKGDKVAVEHCADCPSNSPQPKAASSPMRTFSKKVVAEPTPKQKAAPREPIKEVIAEVEQEVKEHPYSTVEAVLKSFDGDVDMMKAYCEKNGITVGNSKKPETIAGKIVEHHA